MAFAVGAASGATKREHTVADEVITATAGINSSDKYVLCPFFKGWSSGEIRCEGPFDGVNVRLMFETRAGMSKQREIFCRDCYKRCEIYRCVMGNKYPEA